MAVLSLGPVELFTGRGPLLAAAVELTSFSALVTEVLLGDDLLSEGLPTGGLVSGVLLDVNLQTKQNRGKFKKYLEQLELQI